MQLSRQQVIDVLRRTGFPELAEAVLKALPDPVEFDDVVKFVAPYGISRDFLVSRMGSSL